ncbi:hypothetical protein MUP77_20155 [Candidatus Bathyarchaeota archaeon]|nr:hypothetical protein [Candidatus Bathyarchaeota archaeon]
MSDVITYPLSAAIELCEQLDNDTPETDAAEVVLSPLEGDRWVRVGFARKLERERDEAKIDAQKSKAYKRVLKETNLRQAERIRYLEGATNHACGTPLSVALKERDEAIAGRQAYKLLAVKHAQERDEAREDLEEETKFHHRTHIELIQTQCKLLDMEMQRNEAQEKYATEATEHMLAVNKLCNERDEAREEVRLLQAILDIIRKDSQ